MCLQYEAEKHDLSSGQARGKRHQMVVEIISTSFYPYFSFVLSDNNTDVGIIIFLNFFT